MAFMGFTAALGRNCLGTALVGTAFGAYGLPRKPGINLCMRLSADPSGIFIVVAALCLLPCVQLGGAAAAGMPCTLCPHPTCRHAPARTGVASCPACEAGTLVLDPVSAPSWRLDCSKCNFLVYLPRSLHAAKVAANSCEVGQAWRPAGVMAGGVPLLEGAVPVPRATLSSGAAL